MTKENNGKTDQPTSPLPRRYVEPILFLAEKMASKDKILPVPKPSMVDQLAEAVGLDKEQRRRWFHDLDEDDVCAGLDLEKAKKGALVVLSLVLKSDTTGGEHARNYFSVIRGKLGADPIHVPAELEEHKELALRYLAH